MTLPSSDDNVTAKLLGALQHPNSNVRAAAASALGALSEKDAVKPLLAALQDPTRLVQQNACKALASFGVSILSDLLSFYQDRTDPNLRQQISIAIALVRDVEAVDVLSSALNYLEPPACYGAAQALGRIADSRAVPALTQATQSADSKMRRVGAEALLLIGHPEAVQALTAMIDEKDPRIRQVAIKGLGVIGGVGVVPTLLSVLNDEDFNVRYEARAALKLIEDPDAQELLLTSLNANSAWIQQTVATVLGNFSSQEVQGRLIALLNEQGDLQTRISAAEALSLLGDERGTMMLLRTLNAPNVDTRRKAAIALAKTGDERAFRHLVDTIRTKNIDTSTARGRFEKSELIEGISNIGRAVSSQLTQLLVDDNVNLRDLAKKSLKDMDSAAVPTLIEILESTSNYKLRVEIARLLGQIGDPRAVAPLSHILRKSITGIFMVNYFARLFYDHDSQLRSAAAVALGEIETFDGAAILLSAARFDPDPEIRQVAAGALSKNAAPQIAARFAEVDILGFVNRAMVSALTVLMISGLVTVIHYSWGVRDAVLLAGLASGAVFGLVDGFEGRKLPVRGALLASLLGILLMGAFHSFIDSPTLVSLIGFFLGAIGALTGIRKIPLISRLAGLFAGMVLGFLGAGLVGLILGTIN